MNFSGYPTFNFDLKEIEAYYYALYDIDSKSEYMRLLQDAVHLAAKVDKKLIESFYDSYTTFVLRERFLYMEQHIKDGYPLFNFDSQMIHLRLNTYKTLEQKCKYIIDVLVAAGTEIGIRKLNPDFLDEIIVATEVVKDLLGDEILLQHRKAKELKRHSNPKDLGTISVDFDFEIVINHCAEIQNLAEQIEYLEFILKEFNHYMDVIDTDTEIDLQQSNFDFKLAKKLEREIEFRERQLSRQRQTNSVKQAEPVKEQAKVQWLGTEAQLVYLIELLIKDRFLPENINKWSLLERLFENKKGQPFKSKQLAQASQNLLNNKDAKPKGSAKLDEVRANLKSMSE